MSGTLRDRMAELADDAPDSTPETAHELWRRGRRTARVRRTGTAVIAGAAVIALLAVVGVSWQRARPAAVQPAGGGAALPMEVWAPSKWLPGTDDKGPLGQLAAITEAERGGWTGVHVGYVGVSATTGEYRFLDLPDLAGAPDYAPSLSPDGRHVAYWITGPTKGAPNHAQGDAIAGVAIYDAASGDVQRFLVASRHGLSPESLDGLLWADDDHVAFGYSRYLGGIGGVSVGRDPLQVWTVGRKAPIAIPGAAGVGSIDAAGDGRLLIGGNPGEWIVPAANPAGARKVGPTGPMMIPLALHGDRVAGVPGNRTPAPFAVGTISAHGRMSWRRVPGVPENASLVGWKDAHHIVVDQSFGLTTQTRVVDVRDGNFRLSVEHSWGADGFQWALDLFNAPSAARDAPPTPMDPRMTVGLAVVVVILGAGALLLWRRRAGL